MANYDLYVFFGKLIVNANYKHVVKDRLYNAFLSKSQMTICTELKCTRHETAHHYMQVAYATYRNMCKNKG